MIAVITLIELKNPFKFFALSYNALQIIKQLKSTKNIAFKSKGLWTTHYTMSLWENKEDMQSFARSGAHMEAMKLSAQLAKEIRTLTITVDALPNWNKAIELLRTEGKILTY
ncbi:MAG: DUF3291 domain-containing protein [bacterium]|nr:DUF3291 domain-containing protein [bacterium]